MKEVDDKVIVSEPDPDSERTRPKVPRANIHPEWLRHGNWVLFRRNGRFGCVVGEHQHSPRTVFEIIVGMDGTQYLIPLDEVVRVLRPLADPDTAESMRRILVRRHSEVGSTLPALKQALCSPDWANHLPENAAAILHGCYRHAPLRRDEYERPFHRMEELVLTEIALALGVGLEELTTEVHAAQGSPPGHV